MEPNLLGEGLIEKEVRNYPITNYQGE